MAYCYYVDILIHYYMGLGINIFPEGGPMKLDFKKVLVACAAAVVSFFLLAFIIKPILSINVLVAILSLGIGYGVYRLLELWEQRKAAAATPSTPKS
jgi:hypothetical protein